MPQKNGDTFLYRTVTGRRYEVRFEDCVSFNYKVGGDITPRVMVDTPAGKKRKTFLIDAMAINFAEFLVILQMHDTEKHLK